MPSLYRKVRLSGGMAPHSRNILGAWMLLALLVLVTFTSASANASAKSTETDRIEEEYSACMDKSAGVTMNMRECSGNASARMEKRLNQLYKLLMSKLPQKKKELLKNAQKKWLAFRDAESELSYALDPNEGGTLQQVSSGSFAYEMLKKRVTDLGGYLAN